MTRPSRIQRLFPSLALAVVVVAGAPVLASAQDAAPAAAEAAAPPAVPAPAPEAAPPAAPAAPAAPAGGAARAAPAADNVFVGLSLKKYVLDRAAKDDPVLAGRRFLVDLAAVSPAVHASVVDAVRSDIQADETKRFARQKNFVLWAYGAAWAIVAGLAGSLLLRQRRLAAELAVLEARVKVEK